MAHFAQVLNGTVVQVIVAEQEFIDSLENAIPGEWIQTSYNTFGGVHTNGGTPLRKNYAGIGHTYDSERDAFIPPKDFPSWTLNEDTCLWDPPTPAPEPTAGKIYYWNEDSLSWIEDTE